jgi:hypothetical protein
MQGKSRPEMALRKSSMLGIILPYLRILEDLRIKMIILGDEISGNNIYSIVRA